MNILTVKITGYQTHHIVDQIKPFLEQGWSLLFINEVAPIGKIGYCAVACKEVVLTREGSDSIRYLDLTKDEQDRIQRVYEEEKRLYMEDLNKSISEWEQLPWWKRLFVHKPFPAYRYRE